MFILTGVGVPGAICAVLALNSLQKSAERIPRAPVDDTVHEYADLEGDRDIDRKCKALKESKTLPSAGPMGGDGVALAVDISTIISH